MESILLSTRKKVREELLTKGYDEPVIKKVG